MHIEPYLLIFSLWWMVYVIDVLNSKIFLISRNQGRIIYVRFFRDPWRNYPALYRDGWIYDCEYIRYGLTSVYLTLMWFLKKIYGFEIEINFLTNVPPIPLLICYSHYLCRNSSLRANQMLLNDLGYMPLFSKDHFRRIFSPIIIKR